MKAENQSVTLPLLHEKRITLTLKREDLLHPIISGNKFRKLKYNLEAAKAAGQKTVLTFGGAYSNHIAATAYAGKVHRLKTIGVIRGEELSQKWQSNPTLKWAVAHGMQLKFVSRDTYKTRGTQALVDTLQSEFGPFYLLPEGGTNSLAIQGCEEIISADDAPYNVICTAVGTGGTLAGISNAAYAGQSILGFSALKGDFLNEDIRSFTSRENWRLLTDYHFGGYAKVSADLIHFINDFKKQTQIALDPIYTGKMIYGILDMVAKDHFKPNDSILAIHTGGLQGVAGMNDYLKKKKLPLIAI